MRFLLTQNSDFGKKHTNECGNFSRGNWILILISISAEKKPLEKCRKKIVIISETTSSPHRNQHDNGGYENIFIEKNEIHIKKFRNKNEKKKIENKKIFIWNQASELYDPLSLYFILMILTFVQFRELFELIW